MPKSEPEQVRLSFFQSTSASLLARIAIERARHGTCMGTTAGLAPARTSKPNPSQRKTKR